MNDQIVGGEFANADLRTLQREQDRMRNNQLLQDLALRQRALDAETAYRNNALAQQAQIAQMQWLTPNATSAMGFGSNERIAQFPYQMETADSAARNALAREQIQNQLAIARLYTQVPEGNKISPALANTKAGTLYAEADLADRRANDRRQRALAIANAQLAAEGHKFWSTDRGQAQDIIKNLIPIYPEAAELVFDPKSFKFVLPRIQPQGEQVQQLQPTAQPSPTGGQFGQLPPGFQVVPGSIMDSIINGAPTTVAPSMGGFNIGPYRFTPTAQPSPTGGQFNQFPPLDSPTAINPRRMFDDGATMSFHGATATNPQTGERIQFINGRWQPIP